MSAARKVVVHEHVLAAARRYAEAYKAYMRGDLMDPVEGPKALRALSSTAEAFATSAARCVLPEPEWKAMVETEPANGVVEVPNG